jgi:L-ascorbate metabolism protein UlaG (beta-lactamase superfamily)
LWFAVLFCGAVFTGCQRSLAENRPVQLAAREYKGSDATYVQWLGTSSWIVSRGSDAVVVDPFFTRPSFLRVALSMIFRALAGGFSYDTERITRVLPDLPENTKYVLLGHAHYDHLMDVGYYLQRKSGPKVAYVGSKTAQNIILGFKPEDLKFLIPQDGIAIRNGTVRITAFTSDHAPHIFHLKFMTGEVRKPLDSPPTHAGQYVEGTTRIFFIDFLDENSKIVSRVFVNGAASSRDGVMALEQHGDFLAKHPTNVAILCVPGWDKVENYPNSILRLVDPDHVVLSHYDDFAAPYENGQDPKGKMDFVWFADYDGFVKKLQNLKTEHNYRFMIHEPKTGQCLRFSGSAPILDCQK